MSDINYHWHTRTETATIEITHVCMGDDDGQSGAIGKIEVRWPEGNIYARSFYTGTHGFREHQPDDRTEFAPGGNDIERKTAADALVAELVEWIQARYEEANEEARRIHELRGF